MPGLRNPEIARVVNRYIGVEGGYLGDFTYSSHAAFYPEYCELDIDPYKHEGTTRWRFVGILTEASPRDQLKILKGVLERFPRGEAETTWLCSVIERLENASPVDGPTLETPTAVVQRALQDVEALLKENGAPSAVDRSHTALHGCLIEICDRAGLECGRDPSLPKLLKVIRTDHPQFQTDSARTQEITRILRTLGAVVDALGTLRNEATPAHPNEELLEEPEAMLAINATRSILRYVEDRLRTPSE